MLSEARPCLIATSNETGPALEMRGNALYWDIEFEVVSELEWTSVSEALPVVAGVGRCLWMKHRQELCCSLCKVSQPHMNILHYSGGCVKRSCLDSAIT